MHGKPWGDAEREVTLGADKGYDAQEFIDACLAMNVTPHVAQNKSGRKSAVSDASHRKKRGLRAVPAQAQADRTWVRLGQDRRRHSPGHGAKPQARGPDVRADDGSLKLGAHAHTGTDPSARRAEMGSGPINTRN